MKMPKEKNQNIRYNPHFIREITRGYNNINFDDEDDVMFKAYKRGFNMLYDDLQRTQSQEIPESFHVIVEKAGCNLQTLQQKTAATCRQISNFSIGYLRKLDEESNRIDPEYADILNIAFNTWYEALDTCHLREGIELIRIEISLLKLGNTSKIQIPIYGDLDGLILGSLEKIEEKIITASERYRVFQGLSNAHSYALQKGCLISFENFIEKNMTNLSSGLTWYGPNQKTINELFTYGHSIDIASKIRFTNLVEEKGKSGSEAFDIIWKEVKEMGAAPENFLPEDPKNMSDRSNRHMKNRMQELRQIKRNRSKLNAENSN